jgi:hypothetical protein
MSNTLIRPLMILACAMRRVRELTPAGSAPFEVNAKLRFATTALTLRMDEFNETYVWPAIDAAMKLRHPFTGSAVFTGTFGCDMNETAYMPAWGVSGRILRTYDIGSDIMPAAIDVRVFADEAAR